MLPAETLIEKASLPQRSQEKAMVLSRGFLPRPLRSLRLDAFFSPNAALFPPAARVCPLRIRSFALFPHLLRQLAQARVDFGEHVKVGVCRLARELKLLDRGGVAPIKAYNSPVA